MWIWQRPQQHRIHHAEDGGVCTDAECQRQDRNGSEAGLLPQHSQRITQFGHADSSRERLLEKKTRLNCAKQIRRVARFQRFRRKAATQPPALSRDDARAATLRRRRLEQKLRKRQSRKTCGSSLPSERVKRKWIL